MSSVRKKDQSEHRFTVLDAVLDMYSHTITLISNEKIFDRKYTAIINRLEEEARMIYHYARSANEDYDNRKKDEAEIRIRMEEEAIELCKWLKTDVRLSKKIFHLSAKKVAYWTKLINTAMSAIKGWHEGEKRNYIDHFIKERLRVKHYIRYMDDFLLLHSSKEFLEHCLSEIRQKLEEQEMNINEEKTFIQPITKTIKFLGFNYRLTNTGKVVILAGSKKIKHEKKKVKRMIALVHKGKMTKHDVDKHFKSWKSSVRYGNSHKLMNKLNRWYDSLWEGNYEHD